MSIGMSWYGYRPLITPIDRVHPVQMTIIGGTLAFGGGMVVEGGQVQRRGVKEGGRRDDLAPDNDGSEYIHRIRYTIGVISGRILASGP